jgi:hypothetical protein
VVEGAATGRAEDALNQEEDALNQESV